MSDIYENRLDECSLTFDEYKKQYIESIQNPEKFWSGKAKALDWITPFTKVVDENFSDNADIRWFDGGSLNVSYNCIDRHLKNKGDKVAIIWESDDPSVSQEITYNQLHKKVCKLANGLKKTWGKKRG
jgi:acetyl-CoA synthetase